MHATTHPGNSSRGAGFLSASDEIGQERGEEKRVGEVVYLQGFLVAVRAGAVGVFEAADSRVEDEDV